jgi:ubiquinone/menaquinone biosynthesis C-methylase UbiE
MKRETEEKLAHVLTAETTELIPFLPYLLQDLWELGSNPQDMIRLIKKYMHISKDTKILDIACGKGPVSIRIAEELGINVYGFDLMPEFIKCAKQKAKEFNVESLCHFTCADANEIVNQETNYDCVIFGGAGEILGDPQETLIKLSGTIKHGGFILIDEAYLIHSSTNEDLKYKKHEYLTREQWMKLFESTGLKLVEEAQNIEEYDFDSDNKAIAARAEELIAKHPEKEAIFRGYIQSQLNECADLKNNIVAVTWILQKL